MMKGAPRRQTGVAQSGQNRQRPVLVGATLNALNATGFRGSRVRPDGRPLAASCGGYLAEVGEPGLDALLGNEINLVEEEDNALVGANGPDIALNFGRAAREGVPRVEYLDDDIAHLNEVPEILQKGALGLLLVRVCPRGRSEHLHARVRRERGRVSSGRPRGQGVGRAFTGRHPFIEAARSLTN